MRKSRRNVDILAIRSVRALLAMIALMCWEPRELPGQSLFPLDTLTRRSRLYDVLHYKLEVAFDEDHRKVIGTTSITVTPLRPRLDSMVLDAVNLGVDSVVLSGGTRLRWTSAGATLAVQFPAPVPFGDTVTVAVSYSCVPERGLYFLRPDSSNPKRHEQIWTQGEDMENRYWFPCYDYPNDKATSEVVATVRDELVVVSNGRLEGVSEDRGKRTKTFHWRETLPHSSYLIVLVAGEYAVLQDQYQKIPLLYYVYKEQVEDARRTFAKTGEMLEFFEKTIGISYPWEKLAQIIIDDFMWGGMENTSAITLNAVTILDRRADLDFSSDDVISHEIAHQWWGDLVTFRDWPDMWLSEGFADYFEAMFKEYDKGLDEFQYERMQSAIAIRRAEEILGRKPIVSQGGFTANTYAKGGWVLHMLRNMLGDETFLRGLRYYLRGHEFQCADTHELERAIEDATGWNLDWFFEQWVYKAGYPQLEVSRSWDADRGVLSIRVRQKQEMDSLCGVFKFPLDIECRTKAGNKLVSAWIDSAEQTIMIPLDAEPRMVILDKGQKILKSLTMERSIGELVEQLRQADEVNDRVEAAQELRRFGRDEGVFDALARAAMTDRFWGVRREATVSLGVLKDDRLKDTLFAIYSDPDARVRHAAVAALQQMEGPEVGKFLERAAETDSSYLVVGSCIRGLANVDSTRAMEMALRFVEGESYRDILRRACLSVMRQTRDPRALSCGIKYADAGFPVDIRADAVKIIVGLGKEDLAARTLLMKLVADPASSVRVEAARGLGGWGGDECNAVLEQRKLVEPDQEVLKVIDEALTHVGESEAK